MTKLFAAVLVLSSAVSASAEVFESLTYTPPSGWTRSDNKEGRIYVREEVNGVGVIALIAARPSSASPADDFAQLWRSHMDTNLIPGPPPQPRLGTEGEFTISAGMKSGSAQGRPLEVSLIIFSGQGRVFGVLTVVSEGNAITQPALAFLGSLKLAQAVLPNQGSQPIAASAPDLGVDFDIPPGYTAVRDGSTLVLTASAETPETPCTFGITPTRASTGDLRADAEAALPMAFPGWESMGNDYRLGTLEGSSPAGWPFVSIGGIFWQHSFDRFNGIVLVFPAGRGRVNVVWGKGLAYCMPNERSLKPLVARLRPRGISLNQQNQLNVASQELVGKWLWTNNMGRGGSSLQYTFSANGRYRLDSVSKVAGNYAVRGNNLTLTPDGRAPEVYRFHIYDQPMLGTSRRTLSLEGARGMQEYYRVDGN